MTPGAEIKPGPHWWKASTLTTRPTLPPVTLLPYHPVITKFALFPIQIILLLLIVQNKTQLIVNLTFYTDPETSGTARSGPPFFGFLKHRTCILTPDVSLPPQLTGF